MNETLRGKGVTLARAPLLEVGREEFVGGFRLGKTVLHGAAIMVEFVYPNGELAGHICSSLIGTHSIKRNHISGFSE